VYKVSTAAREELLYKPFVGLGRNDVSIFHYNIWQILG